MVVAVFAQNQKRHSTNLLAGEQGVSGQLKFGA